MKNELYRNHFEPKNPQDEREVKLRKMWKEEKKVSVLFGGKTEDGWRISGIFGGEDGEPLKVRSINPDQTRMMMADADEFLSWQKEIENSEK